MKRNEDNNRAVSVCEKNKRIGSFGAIFNVCDFAGILWTKPVDAIWGKKSDWEMFYK